MIDDVDAEIISKRLLKLADENVPPFIRWKHKKTNWGWVGNVLHAIDGVPLGTR